VALVLFLLQAISSCADKLNMAHIPQGWGAGHKGHRSRPNSDAPFVLVPLERTTFPMKGLIITQTIPPSLKAYASLVYPRLTRSAAI